MKKSLSVLLSAAMALGAFASVASAADPVTAQEKFDALKAANIFAGVNANGDAGLNQKMTRAEYARVVGLLKGLNVDAEPTAQHFTDVSKSHWAYQEVEAVYAANIMIGTAADKFSPSANMKVEDTAIALSKVLGLTPVEGATVAGADAYAAPYLQALINNGINLPTNYKEAATREDLVNASYAAYVAINPVAQAATVTAVGAKSLKVTFGKAVEDTSKATFTVKKSTISLNVADKVWAADKKSVTLELSSKLSAGDYTVTVGGVAAADLTATVKAEDEKVAKIEFKATNAPLADIDNDTYYDDLAIPYQVSNQYGENITKTTSLTTNIGTVNSNKGLVEINGSVAGGTYKVGDIVTVTLVHAQTATSAVQTFTVAAQARVAEVAIAGLYNVNNKELNENTNLSTDPFYLLVDAKDQYGNTVSDPARLTADLVINQTNTLVARVNPTFTTVTVAGVDRTALQLTGGVTIGQSNVTLISNTTGKNATYNIVVGEATRVDSVNLINPGLIAANETAYIPIEAYDKNGNVITDVSVLNNTTKGLRLTWDNGALSYAVVIKDKVPQIKINNTGAAGMKSLIAMTSSNKVQTLLVDVKAQATPTIVRGFDSGFATAIKNTGSSTVSVYTSDLAIEDQYGRVMSTSAVNGWLSGSHKIYVTDEPSNLLTVNGATYIDNVNTHVTYDVYAGAKGSEKLTVTLNDGASPNGLAGSSYTKAITVTDGSEYVSYTVDAIGKVYDEVAATMSDSPDYNKTIKVYGVLSNGSKVRLGAGEYQVNALTNSAVNNDVYTDGVLNVAAALTSYGDKSEFTVPVTVTINATGQQLVQDVTFSKATPVVANVKVVDGSIGSPTIDDDAVSELTVTGSTYSVADLLNGTLGKVVVADQYGASKVANSSTGGVTFGDGTVSAANFTITKVAGNGTITNNGSAVATISGLSNGSIFDVTITYVGGAKTTVRIYE